MNKILLSTLLFFLTAVCTGQKKDGVHQISVSGGYLSVYRGADINLNGFSVATFYHYTPLRWVGLQTGVQYNYTKSYFGNDAHIHAPVQLPLYLVIFPGFRFSITGGIYYEFISGHLPEDFVTPYMKVQNVWGYGIGLRRNFRPLNIKLEYKKAMKPWYTPLPEAVSDKDRTSWSINVMIEVPIWRNHK